MAQNLQSHYDLFKARCTWYSSNIKLQLPNCIPQLCQFYVFGWKFLVILPKSLFLSYSSLQDYAGTKGMSGEPQVTSYHRQFMGTVDYIWLVVKSILFVVYLWIDIRFSPPSSLYSL